MSDLRQIQLDVEAARKETSQAALNLLMSKEKLQILSQKEIQVSGTSNENERAKLLAALEEEKKNLIVEIGSNQESKLAADSRISNLLTQFAQNEDPVKSVEKLNDSFPFLLFPLRLETRFKSTGNQKQLWLRVYPDDCLINNKQELLSESEVTNAKSFWTEIWKAGGIEEQERGAWRSLVNSHGSGRAAWIISEFKPKDAIPKKDNKQDVILTVVLSSNDTITGEQQKAISDFWIAVWKADGDQGMIDQALKLLVKKTDSETATLLSENYIPVNIADPLTGGFKKEDVIVKTAFLIFPDYNKPISHTSWTNAPKVMGLPDRMAVVCYNGNNKRVVLFDNPVSENLAAGPDPSLPDNLQMKQENGDLKVNEDLKWMVDFEKAIEVGMGVKIDLAGQETTLGFDKIFVLGLRISSDETASQELVEKLFSDHFYSKTGMGLIRQGTPTNNTGEDSSGYTWHEDPDDSFKRLYKKQEDSADVVNKYPDWKKLTGYLGIKEDDIKLMPNANESDQQEAVAMNTALFQATMGYFMEEMMSPLFTERDIEETRAFFTKYVSGRGPLPSIRIGRQPYGILPITAFSKMQFAETFNYTTHLSMSSKVIPFARRLHALLSKMDTTWDQLVSEAAYIGKSGDPHQNLLDVIGLHSGSVEFHQRYSESIQQLYNQLTLQFGHRSGDIIAEYISERGKLILKNLNVELGDVKLPILEKFFLSEPNLLAGPLIDDIPASEIKPIRSYYKKDQNYIQWLGSCDAETIRKMDFGDNAAPNALLFLLLRHSLMLAQSDAGANILLAKKLVESKKVFHDPDFINIQSEGLGKSKFGHLFSANPKITGNNNTLLIDYIYRPEVLINSNETINLRATIDALKYLENVPTARLERLLTEHIDCCNYRIDAWKTGLIHSRLHEQRLIGQPENTLSKGLYLGAYGWLHDVRPENKVLSAVKLNSDLSEIFNKQGDPPLQTDSKNLGYIHAPSLNQAATAAILRNTYETNADAGNANLFSINLTSDRVRMANSFLEGVRNGQSLSALLGYQFERGLHDKHSLGKGEVDMFIYPLRKKFPLVADNLVSTLEETNQSIEAIEARNVLDGLKFIHHIQQPGNSSYPFGINGLPKASDTQKKAINAEADRLLNVHDAISDMVISEEVYQVVQGNFERAAGNADAFSKGSHPPEIEVVNTPRSGVTLTQRVAIEFDSAANPDISPLTGIDMTPRAKAEPAVNKWMAAILPDPDKVQCVVSYSSPSQPTLKRNVTQKQLGLQPIDLLYLFNPDMEQAMTALDDVIMNYIRYNVSNYPKTDLRIEYTTSANTSDKSIVSFFEMASLIRSLRKVLIESKFILPADITLPAASAAPVPVIDTAELMARVNVIISGLRSESSEPVGIIIKLKELSTGCKSIAGLSAELKARLTQLTSDTGKVDALLAQFRTDLKDVVIDTSLILLKVSDYKVKLGEITSDGTLINNMGNLYGTALNDYAADFPEFDNLVKNVTENFAKAGMVTQSQTGFGFAHDGIRGVYTTIFDKLQVVLTRWNKKALDYTFEIDSYTSALTDIEKLDYLRKAERIISSVSTFPVPDASSHATYKSTIIDAKKIAFDDVLHELNSLTASKEETLTGFLAIAEPVISRISSHDLVAFDTESTSNTLIAEKKTLISLKEDIVIALENLIAELTKKTTEAEQMITDAAAITSSLEKTKLLILSAKKLLGEDALLLPRFTMSEDQGNEFFNSYNTRENLFTYLKSSENRIFPVDDWLAGSSRVREKLAQWENIAVLAEGFNPAVSIELTPIQFPFKTDDRWLAMKFRDKPEDYAVNSDKLLYTVHFASPFVNGKPQCGVLLDEWTEVIPGTEETTGIAFHYDQPNSEPPQALLLVTPPVIKGNWSWTDIIEALEETFSMAKKRAVEPSQIEKTPYAQFVPATMMAVTLYWITMATNLSMNNLFYNKIKDT